MKRKLPFLLLCTIFLGIAGFSGYKIITISAEYRAGEQVYEELQNYVTIETPAPTPSVSAAPDSTTPPEDDSTSHLTVDFEALQAINSDVVAWIYIEGTSINYPVVQGSDNSYYLTRTTNGSYNSAGSIFMDYRNQPDFTDQNTVIYGHYMNNDTMFAALFGYKKQAFFEEHPTFLILTPEQEYRVEIFAGYVASVDDPSWNISFSSQEEYQQWLNAACQRSAFTSGVTPSADDAVVTLSTCSYEFDNARFVLHGILKTE